MDLIKRLIEQRAKAWEEAKGLLDAADTEGRDLDAAEQEQWGRINADLDTLDKRIADLNDVEARNKRAADMRAEYGAPPADTRSGGETGDVAKLRALARGETRAVEFRDLTVGSAAAGGNTVPTGFVRSLWEHMTEHSAIRQTRATVYRTDSGEALLVPKTTGVSTAAIVAEGNPIGESDPTFGQVQLDAYKYAFLLQVSNELLQDTGVDLVGFLARQGGMALGDASGAHFVTGDGSSKPRGVITAATVGKTGGAGVAGAFTADDLIDLYFSVIGPYRVNGEWLVSDEAMAALRKLKDQNDQYIWSPALSAGERSEILGKPVYTDPNIAAPALSAKPVAFGDFSAYAIRDVASVRIERSDDYAFNTDLVTWRYIVRTDGDLVDETGAVKVFQGNAA